MTERAKSILNAVEKIENWCNLNIKGDNYKIFVLRKESDTYSWSDFIYSVREKSIMFAKGDHSRWGANDWSFKTGMEEKDFDYYFYKSDGGSGFDYKKVNKEGNLFFESELISLIRNWETIKKELISISSNDEFNNFIA